MYPSISDEDYQKFIERVKREMIQCPNCSSKKIQNTTANHLNWICNDCKKHWSYNPFIGAVIYQ